MTGVFAVLGVSQQNSERGRVVVVGSAQQLRDDPRVQAAYLGAAPTA